MQRESVIQFTFTYERWALNEAILFGRRFTRQSLMPLMCVVWQGYWNTTIPHATDVCRVTGILKHDNPSCHWCVSCDRDTETRQSLMPLMCVVWQGYWNTVGHLRRLQVLKSRRSGGPKGRRMSISYWCHRMLVGSVHWTKLTVCRVNLGPLLILVYINVVNKLTNTSVVHYVHNCTVCTTGHVRLTCPLN